MRKNLAEKIRKNFAAIKFSSINEWGLLKSLIAYGCLDEEVETIEEAFYAVDIHDTDGKVSFDEILDLAKESGLFS